MTSRPAQTPVEIDVLGVRVAAVNPSSALQRIEELIEADDRGYVCVTGAHGIVESQDDPELLDIHNRATLVVPDGTPLVWVGHRLGQAAMARVYGPDFVVLLARRAAERGWSVFSYGGQEGVAEQFGTVLNERYGVAHAGSYCPPFRPLDTDEEEEVVRSINESGAEIVMVGLSTPKQERWMAAFRDRLDPPLLIGVGAAFDFHTGRLRQAPSSVQRLGLEWLFRALVEPRRLGPRYVRVVPRFILGMVRRRPTLVPPNGE